MLFVDDMTGYVDHPKESVECYYKYEVNLVFVKIYLFIWERERERVYDREGQRGEGERENLRQTPYWAWNPMQGSISPPWDHDLNWNQESEP